MAASTSSAVRQSNVVARRLVSGWKMKLASPATSVTVRMARWWSGVHRLIRTVNAAS
jgi:hypothetical protein